MLDRLRQEAIAWLAGIEACTLASAGPAGVQASWVECLASGLRLYLLLPSTADHLLNIEATGEVALAGDGWRLSGRARCLEGEAGPWLLTRQPWQTVVEVIPISLHEDEAKGQPSRSLDFAPLHP
jgi:hypothetical protein